MPIEVVSGPFSSRSENAYVRWEDDDWGAALLSGPLMVGISRGGRVLVCPDWRFAICDPRTFGAMSCVIECESDGSSFDLGGWLSVRDNRIAFEIQDRVYVLALDEESSLPIVRSADRRPSFAFNTSLTQLAVPVSFMSICEDSIMTTYTVSYSEAVMLLCGTPECA